MVDIRAWTAGAGEGPAVHCVSGTPFLVVPPFCLCQLFVPEGCGVMPRRFVRTVRMQFGRYYEEFEVGAVYRHWPGKTVTESDDHLFCLITMNHHPLHMDA